MNRLLCCVLCSALGLFGLSGCGGTSSGHLPVDSPIMSFEPPDEEDLVDEPLEAEEDDMDDEEALEAAYEGQAGKGGESE